MYPGNPGVGGAGLSRASTPHPHPRPRQRLRLTHGESRRHDSQPGFGKQGTERLSLTSSTEDRRGTGAGTELLQARGEKRAGTEDRAPADAGEPDVLTEGFPSPAATHRDARDKVTRLPAFLEMTRGSGGQEGWSETPSAWGGQPSGSSSVLRVRKWDRDDQVQLSFFQVRRRQTGVL